jgi:arylsulfatase A-like enzyme
LNILKPNILFLVIDSLRADKIYDKSTTKIPNIDLMKKNGVYFSNAITTNQYTSQVMQSIFSNRFLFDDSITKNYSKNISSENSFLSILNDNGYHTYTLNQEDVFLQGFNEKFNDNDSFKSEENIYNGLETKILKKIPTLKESWLYYIHLQDLHTPCVVPDELGHLTLVERYDYNLSRIDSLLEKILKLIDIDNTLVIFTADHGEYLSSVDGPLKEIKGVKTNVKKLVKNFIPNKMREEVHLKKQSLNREIHASKVNLDHEKRMLSYKRQFLNQTLFDDIIRVPLIFYGHGIESSKPISQQICNIDIFPSIFDIIQIPNSIKNGHGKSLIPLIQNPDFESNPIYLTSMAIIPQLKMNINIDKNSGMPLIGIRNNKFKYFRNYENSDIDVHLYDLVKDPLEDVNIANDSKEILKNMELILQKLKYSSQSFESNNFSNNDEIDDDEIDDDEIERAKESLKKLGYI